MKRKECGGPKICVFFHFLKCFFLETIFIKRIFQSKTSFLFFQKCFFKSFFNEAFSIKKSGFSSFSQKCSNVFFLHLKFFFFFRGCFSKVYFRTVFFKFFFQRMFFFFQRGLFFLKNSFFFKKRKEIGYCFLFPNGFVFS